MTDTARAQDVTDRAVIEPPRWSHCFLALAGVVLLIGPTLGVLWPR